MVKAPTPKIKTQPPEILAFSRRLEVSDALMTSGLWDNVGKEDSEWKDIKLHDKRNRATHSQYGAKKDKKEESNLSWGDDAALPHDADTLRIQFSLKVMGGLREPAACNDPDFKNNLSEVISRYGERYQFIELATRYAHNIANGRFLWRNRVGAENLRVKVKHREHREHREHTWIFDDHQLDDFVKPEEDSHLAALTKVVQRGLQGDSFEHLEVTAFAKLGFVGARVWPSQEMVLNIPKGEKSKILFQLNGCAAIHSEKIGNALRTIDTWYSEGENIQAIAVEPFGSVTTRGEAHRKSKNDFYTLLIKWLKNSKMNEQAQHYVIAILIRGGVFGAKSDK